MSGRLTLDYLEQIPKVVQYVSTWRDPGKLLSDPSLAAKVVHVVRCIESGTPLPTTYYRKGVGLDSDALLETHGIMHLHLGRSNTSELLYLVQYADRVALLELSDHSHFRTRPAGSRLLATHAFAVTKLEKEVAAAPVRAKQPLMKQRRLGAARKAGEVPDRDKSK